MTSTDRLAEMAAEIERLRAEVEKLREEKHELCIEGYRSDTQAIRDAGFWATNALNEMAAEIERLRARITELEALVTVGHGTMGTLQQPTPDEPATITHNVSPNAPPHDEPQPPIGHTIKWPARIGDDHE